METRQQRRRRERQMEKTAGSKYPHNAQIDRTVSDDEAEILRETMVEWRKGGEK